MALRKARDAVVQKSLLQSHLCGVFIRPLGKSANARLALAEGRVGNVRANADGGHRAQACDHDLSCGDARKRVG